MYPREVQTEKVKKQAHCVLQNCIVSKETGDELIIENTVDTATMLEALALTDYLKSSDSLT